MRAGPARDAAGPPLAGAPRLLSPLAVLSAAALLAGAHWLMIYVFSVFPGELPGEVLAWSLPAVAALLLWLMRVWRTWRTGHTPSPGHGQTGPARHGLPCCPRAPCWASLCSLPCRPTSTLASTTPSAICWAPPWRGSSRWKTGLNAPPEPLPAVSLAGWTPPAGLPDGGLLRRAVIPGTTSGFQSREAYIYLPPAYRTSPRPALPVLVLFAGQPGAPADWLTGGALRSRMDRYAAEHHGVAPVVVVVDPNGSSSGNTLCMDSRIARADTFLAVDVPAWIKRTLDVSQDPSQWAAGGFSFGATCAMQMVTRHPDIYSSALAFSSEKEPALAKEREKTIAASFDGDTEAFDRQTPLRLMQDRRFEGHAIYFGAGERDPEFIGYMEILSHAARAAGFTVEARPVPGAGHSWETASQGLPAGLDFLASRWGIRQ